MNKIKKTEKSTDAKPQKDLPPVDRKSSEKITQPAGYDSSVNQSSSVDTQSNADIETGVERITNEGVE